MKTFLALPVARTYGRTGDLCLAGETRRRERGGRRAGTGRASSRRAARQLLGDEPVLDAVNIAIKPPTVPLSVLRRLGQPTFVDEDLESLLGPSYETISHAALEMALGEDAEEP